MRNINYTYNLDRKPFLIHLIFSLAISFSILFIGLILNFILIRLMPGDPVLAYLPEGMPDPVLYEQMWHILGFDKPIIEQFFIYLANLFTGNWGKSISISRGTDSLDLIIIKLPRTIDLLLLPAILGLIFGILIGVYSAKTRFKWLDRFPQFTTFLALSVPIFGFTCFLQYFLCYQLGLFPASGYKTRTYLDPPFVTGFRIIDSLLSGEWYYISDYLHHLTLPLFCMTIFTVALILLQTNTNIKREPEEKSIFSHTKLTLLTFSFIFAFGIYIEIAFGLNGLGKLFIDSIREAEYWILGASVFIILVYLFFISLISNILFGLVKYSSIRKKISHTENEQLQQAKKLNNGDFNE